MTKIDDFRDTRTFQKYEIIRYTKFDDFDQKVIKMTKIDDFRDTRYPGYPKITVFETPKTRF